jgi:Holliday junction DNA helicase RuvB
VPSSAFGFIGNVRRIGLQTELWAGLKMGRPTATFHQFIGQRRVVGHVQRLVEGAKKAGDPCTSMLLTGPAGSGKSTMAAAIAAAYGSQLHMLLVGTDTKPVDICRILCELKHGDVFLADEFHGLPANAQQVFFIALDQWKMPSLTERGIDRSKLESIAQFTLIAATNEPGRIKQALRSRLTRIEFDPYNQKELKAIVERIAESRNIGISPQAANLLAATAQGSPRSIRRRIFDLRHYWSGVKILTTDHVRAFLDSEGIDVHGFTPHQREYLKALAGMPKGQCNVERLAIKLGCDVANVRQEVEIYLIEQGFVDPASRLGRGITPKGLDIVQRLPRDTNDSEDVSDDEHPSG